MASTFKSVIDTTPYTHEQFLMLAQCSMTDLNWQSTILNTGKIIARTKMGLFYSGEQVIITLQDDRAILEANSLQWLVLNEYSAQNAIESLQEYIRLNTTIYTSEQLDNLYQEHLENKGLNSADQIVTSRGKHYATYSIIAINTLVFLVMVISGVSFWNPKVMDIYKWGANVRLYTLGGEWWRLLTSTFLHVGVIHLFFNMLTLFFVGRYLEPIIGKWKFLLFYLCTGILSSLASIWWSGAHVSAGASGAIFGMYGIFIALLTTNLINYKLRLGLLQSFVVFVTYSLFTGMQPGIDNAAHLGGLFSGLLFGYLYYFNTRFKISTSLAVLVILLFTLGFSALYLVQHHSHKIQLIRYLNRFSEKELLALHVQNNKSFPSQNAKTAALDTIAAPAWLTCNRILDSIRTVPQDSMLPDRKWHLLKDYIGLRIRENNLLDSLSRQNKNNAPGLDSLQNNIMNVIYKIGQIKY